MNHAGDSRLSAFILRAVAAGFILVALFHGAALFAPQIAAPAPAWRHGLFAVVNVAVAAGVLVRPRGFALVFALLTAQQLYGHGTYLVEVWRSEGRVDWASVVVLVAIPLVLVLLARPGHTPAVDRDERA